MQRTANTTKHTREGGFSLIELMVALSIFAIVMTSSFATLITMIDANAKAQALAEATSNLTFALDSMTRQIRIGKEYYCARGSSLIRAGLKGLPTADEVTGNPDCSGGDDAIVFTPGMSNNTRVAYRLNNGAIEQWVDRSTELDGWVPITARANDSNTFSPGQVNIKALRFVVEGARDSGDNNYVQPQVTIYVSGEAQNGLDTVTPFQIQSKVTQRILDY